jgi:hypothetical protein
MIEVSSPRQLIHRAVRPGLVVTIDRSLVGGEPAPAAAPQPFKDPGQICRDRGLSLAKEPPGVIDQYPVSPQSWLQLGSAQCKHMPNKRSATLMPGRHAVARSTRW